MDKCVFKAMSFNSSPQGTVIVRINSAEYAEIQKIASATGLTTTKVSAKLLRFALDRTLVSEED